MGKIQDDFFGDDVILYDSLNCMKCVEGKY